MVDPATTTSTSPGGAAKVKAKGKPTSATPTMYAMTLEALSTNKTAKGMSLQAIKKVVLEKYSSTYNSDNFPNRRLKDAITKGLTTTEIARTKATEDAGFRGCFRLNKVFADQKVKEAKQALKLKEKKAAEKEKAAKTSRPKAKKEASSRSRSRSPSKKAAKPKTKVVRSLSRSPSPKPKKVAKPKTVTSPKASAKVKGAATPKSLSKSAKAGAKAKTASVKKLLKKPAAKSTKSKAAKKN